MSLILCDLRMTLASSNGSLVLTTGSLSGKSSDMVSASLFACLDDVDSLPEEIHLEYFACIIGGFIIRF